MKVSQFYLDLLSFVWLLDYLRWHRCSKLLLFGKRFGRLFFLLYFSFQLWRFFIFQIYKRFKLVNSIVKWKLVVESNIIGVRFFVLTIPNHLDFLKFANLFDCLESLNTNFPGFLVKFVITLSFIFTKTCIIRFKVFLRLYASVVTLVFEFLFNICGPCLIFSGFV